MRSLRCLARVFVFVFVVLCSVCAIAEAAVEDVSFELNLGKDVIGITSGFSGEALEIFGLKDRGDDVVLVVKGPARDIMVRRKERMFGGWVDAKHVVFKDVPSFYRVAASYDLEALAGIHFLEKHEIGTENVHFMYHETDFSLEEVQVFRDALVREKSEQALYSADWQKIDTLENRFYRASFYLPHNVPVGAYEVRAYAFRGGEMIAARQAAFDIERIGVNHKVHQYSQANPFRYGFLCVFLALYTGWLSYKLNPRRKS